MSDHNFEYYGGPAEAEWDNPNLGYAKRWSMEIEANQATFFNAGRQAGKTTAMQGYKPLAVTFDEQMSQYKEELIRYYEKLEKASQALKMDKATQAPAPKHGPQRQPFRHRGKGR